MNVRMVPPCYFVLGGDAFFVEGYTGDNCFDWVLIEAPLINGRPNMREARPVTSDRDWSDTPWEGKPVFSEDIVKLIRSLGNLQRAFACIPAVA